MESPKIFDKNIGLKNIKQIKYLEVRNEVTQWNY